MIILDKSKVHLCDPWRSSGLLVNLQAVPSEDDVQTQASEATCKQHTLDLEIGTTTLIRPGLRQRKIPADLWRNLGISDENNSNKSPAGHPKRLKSAGKPLHGIHLRRKLVNGRFDSG